MESVRFKKAMKQQLSEGIPSVTFFQHRIKKPEPVSDKQEFALFPLRTLSSQEKKKNLERFLNFLYLMVFYGFPFEYLTHHTWRS